LENKVKITIEGLEDEPIVFENVKQLFLTTETTDEVLQQAAACDHVFAGYVAARAQMEFNKRLKEVNLND
jgi:hypothetical protein